MKATDLSIGDIGSTFRSITYRNNNKTARPHMHMRWVDGKVERAGYLETEWTLDTLYAHANGNIKINNQFHLRPDTELVRITDDSPL